MLRPAQALAQLRFAMAVLLMDVDEALRLMEASRESPHDDDEDGNLNNTGADRIIKDMAQARAGSAGSRWRAGLCRSS